MGAVWLVFAAKFRRHWRSWLLLSLLIGIASGFVLAAGAAARRTDSAFPRYVASHGYDAIVYSARPLPQLARLPEVAQVTPVKLPFHGHLAARAGAASTRARSRSGRCLRRGCTGVAKLVTGRMPDQSSPHEALASFTLQRDYGVRLGTVISLPMPAASQWDAVLKAMAGGPLPEPAGPTIAVRVVGIVAAENEFSFGQGVAYDLYPTRAFAAATRGAPALPAYYVRLRHGQADFARFEAQASGLNGAGVQDLTRPAAAITASIHPQAVGWWVLAALAGLVAIAVVGQALARQAAAESTDHPALAALGLSRRQLAVLGMMPAVAVAAAGAAGAIAVATLLSPLAPMGEARLAEPAPGLAFDAAVIGLGAAVVVAVVQGRLPAANNEIALGASTMRRIGARIGSLAQVTVTSPDGAPHTRRFRVVGLVAFPGDFTTGGLGTGAALTTAGYIAAQCPPSPSHAGCRRAAHARPADLVLVRAAPGPAGHTALAGHIRRHHDNASRPTVPAALVNFGGSAHFPLLLGGVIALCGLATLAHLLMVSVARRRTETGLLMALGMVRRQLAAIVFWQATTIALAAITAGIPLGIAAGHTIWRAFAISLGVVPVPVVQVWLIGALAASVLLTANALATIPAAATARTRPGPLLRTE